MTKKERNEEEHDFTSPIKKIKNSRTSVSETKSVSVRIRKVGNSKGILLSNSMIRELGIADDAEVIVTTEKGKIIIKPAKSKRKINTNLSTWESQFKTAITNGDKPETDMFEGMENKFDKEEW